MAILRYRLYEIDRIISRTLAYATVTGILAVAYGAIVLTLSAVLSDLAQGQTVAVAASTLAVFALFQPVLRRVRHAVDRRFDRAAYDAERTVAAFSERLRWSDGDGRGDRRADAHGRPDRGADVAGHLAARRRDRPMIRRLVAWVAAIASIGVFVVGPLLAPQPDNGFLFFGAAALTSVLVGSLLTERAPGNRVGPLLLLSGGLLATAFGLTNYAALGAAATPPWPGVDMAAIVANALWIYPIGIGLVAIPLIFPDGRLISPGWRWIVALTLVALAASTAQSLITPDLESPTGSGEALGIPSLAGLAAYLGGFSSAMSVIAFGSAVARSVDPLPSG